MCIYTQTHKHNLNIDISCKIKAELKYVTIFFLIIIITWCKWDFSGNEFALCNNSNRNAL